VSVIAPQILHKDVGSVRFRREAVISNINTGISHGQPIDVKRVESICVFWFGLSWLVEGFKCETSSEQHTDAFVE
jgi:hypothetical protein